MKREYPQFFNIFHIMLHAELGHGVWLNVMVLMGMDPTNMYSLTVEDLTTMHQYKLSL